MQMTLEEAIEHCKDIIAKRIKEGNAGCAEEHLQLAEWLIELKKRRDGTYE